MQWLYTNLMEEPRSESYLRNVLSELKKADKIGRTGKTYWLMTQERIDNYAAVGRGEKPSPNGDTIIVVNDLWCQAILSNRETELRNNLKYAFSQADGEVFLTLASIILNKPTVRTQVLNSEDDWSEDMRDRWARVMGSIKRWKGE